MPLLLSKTILGKNDASLFQEKPIDEKAAASRQTFRWLALCRNNTVDWRSKRLPFLRLVKERRFDKIVDILQQSNTDKEKWLNVSQDSRVSTCESLHALCMHRPTVAVVQVVIEVLKAINRNNIDATMAVDAAGRTPLAIGVAFGCSLEVIELLMRDNTAVLTKDHARRYPLHWACENPHGGAKMSKKATDNMVQVINSLIGAYAVAVITEDQQGKTPMELALAAKADPRIVSALHFVAKILPGDIAKDPSSLATESTYEVPREAICCDLDDDDDLSSVGSRGVSRHVRLYLSAKQKVPNFVAL